MKKHNLSLLFAPLAVVLYGFRVAGDGTGGGAAPNPETPPPAAAPTPTPPALDVQAEINRALAAQQAAFSADLEKATGHKDLKALAETKLLEDGKLKELADSKAAEALQFKTAFESEKIQNALLAASAEAIDSKDVLINLAAKGVVDANGNVTFDGKPAKEAVEALFKASPHLAKPVGTTGSGAPHSQVIPDAEKSQQDYVAAAKSGDILKMLSLNTGVKQ
jgi:hypothetical protein